MQNQQVPGETAGPHHHRGQKDPYSASSDSLQPIWESLQGRREGKAEPTGRSGGAVGEYPLSVPREGFSQDSGIWFLRGKLWAAPVLRRGQGHPKGGADKPESPTADRLFHRLPGAGRRLPGDKVQGDSRRDKRGGRRKGVERAPGARRSGAVRPARPAPRGGGALEPLYPSLRRDAQDARRRKLGPPRGGGGAAQLTWLLGRDRRQPGTAAATVI